VDQGGRCGYSCPEDLTFMLDRVQDLTLRQNQAFFLLDLIFRSIFVYLRTTYYFLFKFSCFLHSSFVEASSCLSNVFFVLRALLAEASIFQDLVWTRAPSSRTTGMPLRTALCERGCLRSGTGWFPPFFSAAAQATGVASDDPLTFSVKGLRMHFVCILFSFLGACCRVFGATLHRPFLFRNSFVLGYRDAPGY